ncbi:MAG: transcriptional regulator [Acidobacteriota bacterium]|nr:transcriptional regulator [Acidobacteriota bacterium]
MTANAIQDRNGLGFDDFFLDTGNRVLLRNGSEVALNAKYLDVLIILAGSAGTVVSKQELFDRVWGDVHVTDAALTQCIKDIRKKLGDSAGNPRYIKTLPKRGYQFVARIHHRRKAADDSSPVSIFPKRPYKFLESFGEDDAADFQGRNVEIETVCSQLAAHPTFLVYGRSGVGKSSFLAAGMVPRLRTSGHVVCRVQGRRDPHAAMIGAVAEYLDMDPESEPARLAEALTALPVVPELFLCCDQFEEWFIREGGTASLEQALVHLVNSPLAVRLHCCFVLREDYLAEMSRFKEIYPNIFHHELRLELLDRDKARQAASEPALKVGCRFEEGLLDRILDDLTGAGGVDLPALQIVCDQLFDRRDADGAFTLEAYRRLGSTGGILQDYLDRVLRRFSSADLSAARRAMSLLITEESERRVLAVDWLIRQVHAETGGVDLSPILEELASARVLHIGKEDGRRVVCLVHEYLVPAVSGWMTDAMRRRRRVREVLRRAMEAYEAHGFHMSRESLRLVLDCTDMPYLDEPTAALIVKSCLHHGDPVPESAARACPRFLDLWRQATKETDPEIRRVAVASAKLAEREDVLDDLRMIALDDPVIAVRREASLLLAQQWGVETPDLLAERGSRRGFRDHGWRYLVSLAMIRDYDRGSFSLWSRSPVVGVFIVVCLAWVRLRRHWTELSRQVVGGTVGTSLAGLSIGLILGAVVVYFQPGLTSNHRAVLIAFSGSGLIAGFLAGIAVSTGMVAVGTIAYRHSRLWQVIGAAAGGGAIGVVFTTVANAISETVMGMGALSLTGAPEAASMGAAACLGATLAERGHHPGITWRSPAGAALLGGLVALGLVASGHRLLADSLAGLITSFQVLPDFDSFLTANFSNTARSVLHYLEAFGEGVFFGGGLFGGIALFRRS